MRTNKKIIISAIFALFALALFQLSALAKAGAQLGNSSLSWEVEQSNSYVDLGGAGEILVNMRVRGQDVKLTERAPVNLALVIDRSGSMADAGKLEYAKEAARRIIQGLRDSDRLSIVAYSTEVELLYPTQLLRDKQGALAAVDALYPTDSTNLAGGLIAGVSQIKSLAGRAGYVNRVILLSDGLANAGITDRGEINRIASGASEGGVRITTMGLGVDYDENLMTDVAEYGAGNYYFIESPSQIAGIFEREFNQILATVAKDAVITLAPSLGVRILDVYGYASERENGKARINLGDMFAGQERNVLVRLAAPLDKLGRREFLRASLRFADVLGKRKPAQIENRLEVEVTGDKSKVVLGENKEVVARGISAAAAYELQGATVEYEKGNRASALAGIKKALDKVIEVNSSAQKSEASSRQEAELRDALQEMSVAAPAPESDAGRGFIKEYKAKAREQLK
ncbi:MAG: vWA domain-containing protein [Deltaproteobacteria bacterium]